MGKTKVLPIFFVNNSNFAHKVDPVETLIIDAKLICKK